MIKINLLPREIYAAKAQRQLVSLGLGLAAVVVVVLMGFFLMLKQKERGLVAQLDIARAEEVKYQAIANEVQQLETKKQQLSSRFGVIQQLVTGTLVYPKFFEDFLALLPADVWVTTLNTTTDASYGLAVTVNAQSLSTFAIADWLTNLQSSPLCADVRMGGITVTEETDTTPAVYALSMTFNYRRRD